MDKFSKIKTSIKIKWYEFAIVFVVVAFGGIIIAFIDALRFFRKGQSAVRELGFCCMLCALNCFGIALVIDPVVGISMALVFAPIGIICGLVTTPKRTS